MTGTTATTGDVTAGPTDLLPSPPVPTSRRPSSLWIVDANLEAGECIRGAWKLGQSVRPGEVCDGAVSSPEVEVGNEKPSLKPM